MSAPTGIAVALCPLWVRTDNATPLSDNAIPPKADVEESRSLLRAKSGHSPLYSITSSTRASSVGGITTPSVLAVRMLMTNSNFVSSRTGKSAGFLDADLTIGIVDIGSVAHEPADFDVVACAEAGR